MKELYDNLASASTPEEVMQILDEAGVHVPEGDSSAPMGEPGGEGEEGGPEGEESEGDLMGPSYDDDSGMGPEVGRRADILLAIKKGRAKRPSEDE